MIYSFCSGTVQICQVDLLDSLEVPEQISCILHKSSAFLGNDGLYAVILVLLKSVVVKFASEGEHMSGLVIGDNIIINGRSNNGSENICPAKYGSCSADDEQRKQRCRYLFVSVVHLSTSFVVGI